MTRDWAWSGTIAVNQAKCVNLDKARGCAEFQPGARVAEQTFAVGPNSEIREVLTWNWGYDSIFYVTISDNEFSVDGVSQTGDFEQFLIQNPPIGEMAVLPGGAASHGDVRIEARLGKPGGEYELKFYPRVWAQSPQNVTSAADVRVSQTDTLTSGMQRSKNTGGYVIDQPGRVTAMAKRFIAAPNSLINIHGYGPDKGVALAKGKHVREHLQSEITRLGGNPANYPTFVTYAGDPGHKKGVHVTIHQHDASSIAMR